VDLRSPCKIFIRWTAEILTHVTPTHDVCPYGFKRRWDWWMRKQEGLVQQERKGSGLGIAWLEYWRNFFHLLRSENSLKIFAFRTVSLHDRRVLPKIIKWKCSHEDWSAKDGFGGKTPGGRCPVRSSCSGEPVKIDRLGRCYVDMRRDEKFWKMLSALFLLVNVLKSTNCASPLAVNDVANRPCRPQEARSRRDAVPQFWASYPKWLASYLSRSTAKQSNVFPRSCASGICVQSTRVPVTARHVLHLKSVTYSGWSPTCRQLWSKISCKILKMFLTHLVRQCHPECGTTKTCSKASVAKMTLVGSGSQSDLMVVNEQKWEHWRQEPNFRS